MWEKKKRDPVAKFFIPSERVSNFSLGLRAIRPSAVFGTRRKVVLCRAGYAWTPDLRSFDKLREVGVSPYLGFTLYLSVFQCFGWFEALNDRLIGPKTWDRIIGNFLKPICVVHHWARAVGLINCVIFEINHVLIGRRPEMAMKFGFTK